MNRCKNCGTEFEGQFCPECGTPVEKVDVCPRCGNNMEEGDVTCSRCGYTFSEPQPALANTQQQESSAKSVTFTFNFRKFADILPPLVYGLWAALLWALYSAKVINGGGFWMEDLNVYQLLKNEMVSNNMIICARLLIRVGIACVVYTLVYLIAQVESRWRVRQYFTIGTIIFYGGIISLSLWMKSECNKFTTDAEFLRGDMPILTIVITGIFVILWVAAVIVNKRYGTKKQPIHIPVEQEEAETMVEKKMWSRVFNIIRIVIASIFLISIILAAIIAITMLSKSGS